MSDLVAITFAGEGDALAALGSNRALEAEGRIGPEDTAVVTKDADGKIHVKIELSSGTETGAVVGAVLGSLLLTVFPVVAIVGGAVLGGLVGRSVSPIAAMRQYSGTLVQMTLDEEQEAAPRQALR